MRPYRKEKLASTIQRVIGEAIALHLDDPRLAAFTSVTRVELTADMLLAKVYLEVPGGDTAERLTLAALDHASGRLRRLIASALTLRQCPGLRFEIDQRLKGVRQVEALLDENRRRQPHLFEPPADRRDGGEAGAAEADPSVRGGPDTDRKVEPDNRRQTEERNAGAESRRLDGEAS